MKKVIAMFILLGFLLTVITTVFAGPPQTIEIEVVQAQTRYFPDGTWMHDITPFNTTFELRLTGNVLSGEMTYSPDVESLRSNKFKLIYNGEVDGGYMWVLQMGGSLYTSPYSGFTINEYWEGYLILDEEFNLIKGEFKQIGYCSSPNTIDYYDWAEKGVPPKIGLWCLAWSIYTYIPLE